MDNVVDALTMSKGVTNTATLDIYPCKNSKNLAIEWCFCNNGSPINERKMRSLFDFAKSTKDDKSVLIGRYGLGLKAAACYLGDSLLLVSYDAKRSRITVGFFSQLMLEGLKISNIAALIIDIHSEATSISIDDSVMFDAICKYTNFRNWKEIVNTAKERILNISKDEGGTMTSIFTPTNTYRSKFKEMIDVTNANTNKDILATIPWKEGAFAASAGDCPRFATSYRDHFSILYRRLRHPFTFYLMGERVEMVNPEEIEDIYLAKFARRDTALKWVKCEDVPDLSVTTKFVQRNKSGVQNIYLYAKCRIDDADILSPKALIGGVFGRFNGTFIYNNNRLIGIKNIFRKGQKPHGFSIIESHSLTPDQSKQNITDDTLFFALVEKLKHVFSATRRSKELQQKKLIEKERRIKELEEIEKKSQRKKDKKIQDDLARKRKREEIDHMKRRNDDRLKQQKIEGEMKLKRALAQQKKEADLKTKQLLQQQRKTIASESESESSIEEGEINEPHPDCTCNNSLAAKKRSIAFMLDSVCYEECEARNKKIRAMLASLTKRYK